MGKGYYEDEEVFKYVDEFGIAQTAYKKDAPMFEHQRQPERLNPTARKGCESLNTADKRRQ